MRVLVIGAAGQLGRAAAVMLPPRHEVRAWTRQDVDLCDAPAVSARIRALQPAPEAILNCAAYNNVDGAEEDALGALQVNALAVRTLAEAAEAIGATLVHYSTDFVFDGLATAPYVETDRSRPQSTYGASKLLGEWFAERAPRHYVLRVESLFGGPHTRSSIDKIVASLAAGAETRVFVDRTVTPSYVADVVEATEALLARQAPIGLYHCVSSGVTTWLELAEEIARLLGKPDARLVPVRFADATLRAKRPQYCALSNAKLAAALARPLPAWRDALSRHLARA